MEPFVLLFALLSLSTVLTVPVQHNNENAWQTLTSGQQLSHCASRCRSDPRFLSYQSGKTYYYQFQTETYLDSQQPISLEGAVVLSAFSHCDIALQLERVRIGGVDAETAQQMQMALEGSPLHFGYSDGHVTDVCVTGEDSEWTLNVKKAVVSALQMSSSSLTSESRVHETDLQGACVTTYQPISERFGKHVIRKIKNFAECDDRQQWLTGLFPRAYSRLSQIPITSGQQECVQSIESDIVFGVTCQEEQRLVANKFFVKSQMNLRFERQVDQLVIDNKRIQYQRHYNHLKMSYHSAEDSEDHSQQLEPSLRQLCQQLKEKSSKSSEQFSRLIRLLKKSSEQEIQQIYAKIHDYCPQQRQLIEDLFLDACAHSGSVGSVKVIQQWLQKNKNSMRSQVLLQNLAFVSQPSVESLPILVDILRDNSDQSHVALGVSAYFHNTKHVTRDTQHYREHETRVVKQLMQKVKTNSNEFEKIIAIKALQNIGLESQPEVRQQLAQLAQQQQSPEGVRVAALKALSEAMNGQQERPLVLSIVENERNTNEIRLNALKSLIMSGSSQQEMQRIKRVVDSSNEHVKQYARSLVQNLQETSDPHKKDIWRRIGGQQEKEWPKAENKWFGISNNFETSFMLDAIGVGAVLESDVIYEQQSGGIVPSSVVLNATLPLMGREVNLVEVEVRQKGFDQILEKKIKDIYRELKEKNSRQLVDSIIALVSQWPQISQSQAFVEIGVKVDGKTIFVYHSQHNHNRGSSLKQMIAQLSREGAFAVQPLNTRVQIPSGNGWPIVARVNSTILSYVQKGVISPYIVWQTEAGLQLLAQKQKREVGVAFNIQSAPSIQSIVDYSENRFQMKVSIPEQRISLLKSEAEVSGSGSNGLYGGNSYERCSEWTKKAFGLQLCFAKNSKAMEVFAKKSDSSLESLELKIENQKNEKFSLLFNTPNSQVNRQWEAELDWTNQRQVKLQVKSPFGRVTGSGQMRADEKEQSLVIEMQKNAEKVVFVDLALEQMARGQKREFRPRVQLSWMNRDLIKVGGSVSVAKGRKNQLMINLEGNQKQFLKGSLVREGDRKSADIRVSSDLSLHLLNGLEVKVNALFDKSPKHVTADLQLEYRGQKTAKKESLKTSVKLQSIGQSATAQKLSAFGELTSTQFPRVNCHVAYNLLNKPREHVENELTVQWSRDLKEKVHILQVTKVTNQRAVETTVNVEVTPLGVDYELRANGEQETEQTKAEVSGKDRSGKSSQYDFRGNVQYKHVSRAPLHLTLAADLKTSQSEWKYSDELREQSSGSASGSGEYKGQTSVQWSHAGQAMKMAKMDYEYKKKNSGDHQMELQITSPMSEKPIKHSALLRMSRHDAHVKSRLLVGDHVHHHVESVFSNEGPNRVHVEYQGYRVKGHAHPYELPQRAGLEVMTPAQLIHKTDVEIVPLKSFRLKSDTKRHNANIFALESDISRSKPSKVIFNSKQIEGKVDFRSGSDGHWAEMHLNHLANDWTHSSAVKAIPQQKTIEIQSKTVHKGQPLMVLDSVYNQKQKKVNFLLPAKKTSVLFDSTSGARSGRSAKLEVNCGHNFRHLSEYANEEPEVHRFQSSQSDFRSGSPLYELQYKKNNDVHQLNAHYLQNYVVDGELRPWDQFGDRQGSAFLNLKNKRSQLEHNSKIAFDNRIFKIESQTRKSNQNLAEIDGQLSGQESHLKIKLPRAQTRAHLIYTPSSGAKIQYSAPNADHVTALEWAGPQYACDSKTTLDNHVTYALAGNHYPDRKSFISVKTPNYDVSGHVDRTWDTPSAKLTVITPRTSHVTEVSANRNRKSIRIESRADRKSGPEMSESIYNLDGNYNHMNELVPSNFGLKIAKNWKINGKVQPFGQQKFISVSADHPDYSHVTDLNLNGQEKHVIIKSRTEDRNGRNLAKLDSFIPFANSFKNEKSHVTFVSPSMDSHLEIYPKERSLGFQYRDQKWTHKTSLDNKQILSNTKLNQKQFFDFNGQLDLSGQQSAKVIIKTPSIGHETHFIRTNQNNIQLNSNTDYENQLLNKIAFDSQKHFQVDIPQFSAQTQWSPEGASVDYHSRMPSGGRHVLASIRMPRDRNQFGVDVAWDQQRDPNQRVKLDWEARDEQSRAIHVLRAEYAGNELRVESDVQKRNAIYGPNQWIAKYTPKYSPERDSLEVRVNHVINGNAMECHVTYLEGQKPKLDSKLVTKWSPEVLEMEFDSTSASNPDLNLKMDFKTRLEQIKTKNAKISSEIRIVSRNARQYALQWHVARAQQSNEDSVQGDLVVETPSGGRQEMDFRLSVKEQEIQFSAKSKDRKLLEVNARADNRRPEEKHVQVELKSNIRDIPSAKLSGDYFRFKQLSLRAEVDGERRAEVSVIRTGSDVHSGSQVSARVETSFWPKFESLLSLKKNSEEIDFELNSKLNAKEVFSAILKAKKTTSGVWTGQARVSDNGSQLAQLEAESTSGSAADQFRYELRGNSRRNAMFGALRVLFSVERNRKSGSRVKVNACEETKNTCFDANGLWKESRDGLPERVELTVQKSGKSFQLKASFEEPMEDSSSGQSLFGLTSGRVSDKTRNEVFVAVNGHQMGFEMTSQKRGGARGREHVLRMEFPSKQEMTLKSDFYQQSGSYGWKTQMVDNTRQEVIAETEVEAVETGKDFRLRAEVKSEKFRGRNKNKKIEFWFQKPSQEMKVDFRSKLVISVGEQPITVESFVERKPIQQRQQYRRSAYWNPSSAVNNTLQVRISDQKKIDFQFTAHASPMTAGVEVLNLNRRGVKRFAHLFVQSEQSSGEENRFHAIASTNQKRYRIQGAWLNNELNYQIRDEKSEWKSDVRVALKGKCVEWESRDSGREEKQKKYDLCFNYDNRQDESLQLTFEETSGGGNSQQLNANVEVDTRGQQSVKIDITWTPQLLSDWLKRIQSEEWFNQFRGEYFTEMAEEFYEEVLEKSSLLYSALTNEIVVPVGQLLSDQIGDLFQEFSKIFGNFEKVFELKRQFSDALYRQWQRISTHVTNSLYAMPSLDTWSRHVTRGARKQCQKFEICYKLLYGLEKYGSGAIYDYFQWNSMRMLRESHRLVVATSGRFLSLPLPQWLRDYNRELSGVWQSIIASNPTLQSIVDSIESIIKEVTKDWEQIDGQEVKRATKKLATIVFDVSAQRVVLWDPARGRFSLEIRSNNQSLRRQLRSIKKSSLIGGQQVKKLSEFFA